MKLIPYRSIMSESFPFVIQIKTGESLNSDVHAHQYFQICYVLKGTCLHHTHEKKVKLVKGDLFSIPPMVEHRLETVRGHEAEVAHIDFLPGLLDRNLSGLLAMDGFVDFALIQPFVQLNDTLLPKLNLSFSGQRATEQLIREMMEEYEDRRDGYPLVIKSALQKLLVVAGREFLDSSRQRDEHHIVHLHRKQLEQALDYIDRHYTENVKLQDAAAKAAMSPAYFSTVFKLIKNMTFVDYVNEQRLNEAIRLLKDKPEWSVERICADAGFNHLTHFYRMFKRKTGVTPAQFRRQ